ncbi:hypothetical protein Pen02_41500 [Plantactinospora endophytica]|uniref:Secreted protein n=1 Tax=Plantactinospora endophytica TaxID=673535 RepID=A0ABQ4E3D2_9ACTN|nr:hypothetical protein Pen02_41500 [Plantactinospora endophytica]
MVGARLLVRLAIWQSSRRRARDPEPAPVIRRGLVPAMPPPGAPSWAIARTHEYNVWRSAPLLTLGQEFRGHGGRWPQ